MTTSRLNGICRNPWDTTRTPSGSSGGAAAAVAAGLCAAAHGTDGGGSVRVPAAYCGLVGLKPTRGLVGFGPEEGPAYYQTSVPGVLTKSVRDAAALLDAMASPGPWTPARPRDFLDEVALEPGRLRIGVCVVPPWGGVDEQCITATRAVGRLLESLGHDVEEKVPDWAVLSRANALPMGLPGPAGLVDVEDAERVEPRNVSFVRRMASLTVLEHSRMVDETRAATKRFLRLWDDVDILLTPASGMLPPPVEWATWDLSPEEHRARLADFPAFAQPFNVTGQPGVSVPATLSTEGLPIGVQLVGRHLDEAALLRLATQFEQAVPWADRLRRVADALPPPAAGGIE
jgi:amidase